MTILVHMKSQQMNIRITDNAQPQNASDWQDHAKTKPRQDGGMGLDLVKHICPDVRYMSDETGNQVFLQFDYAK